MDSENRMALRRSLIPLALLAALAAVVSCADPSPMGVPDFRRGGRGQEGPAKGTGVVACSQTYDSVTQVIGPAGGFIVVGSHILWVDTMALAEPVRITAVAPADTVRWVRFQPDGLQFRTNGAGWSAVLFTSFKDCGVPTADPLRIAQVTDSLQVIRYLAPAAIWIKVRKNAWSQGSQYLAGVLNHFSQYAVSW
jgi:predicted pyridoxine 5'-phosphate oxidase superfamily flavin-nucleotide-binding protein